MRSKIERDGKFAVEHAQARDDVVGDLLQQELMSRGVARCPIASAGQKAAIEDVVIGNHAANLVRQGGGHNTRVGDRPLRGEGHLRKGRGQRGAARKPARRDGANPAALNGQQRIGRAARES